VRGHIRYYSNDEPVSDVTVDLFGGATQSVQTDSDGLFSFATTVEENKTLQPSKTGGVNNAVSSLDASRALQQSVGLITLSDDQKLACDVTGNGAVTALDASRILQFRVGLLARFEAAKACDSDWVFRPVPDPAANQTLIDPVPMTLTCEPGAIDYDPLQTPVAGQDFVAILFGDCTGNWAPQP
jgi:hypothetical protein